MTEKRYGFVGIIIPRELKAGGKIQNILERHSEIILGRMGLPHLDENRLAIITLIIHGSTDELGSLTGQLGRIPGITVKSGLGKLPSALRIEDDT